VGGGGCSDSRGPVDGLICSVITRPRLLIPRISRRGNRADVGVSATGDDLRSGKHCRPPVVFGNCACSTLVRGSGETVCACEMCSGCSVGHQRTERRGRRGDVWHSYGHLLRNTSRRHGIVYSLSPANPSPLSSGSRVAGELTCSPAHKPLCAADH